MKKLIFTFIALFAVLLSSNAHMQPNGVQQRHPRSTYSEQGVPRRSFREGRPSSTRITVDRQQQDNDRRQRPEARDNERRQRQDMNGYRQHHHQQDSTRHNRGYRR